MAVLLVRRGPDSGKKFEFTGEMVIGRSIRSRANDDGFFRLEDNEISRRHLRIYRENGKHYIEDLNSTNGTLLKGRFLNPGEPRELNDGDELYLGNSQVVFRLSGHKVQSPPSVHGGSLHSRSARAHKLRVLSEDDVNKPDISMVVDASQILMQLRAREGADFTESQDLVKRMQAIVQVSIELGVTTSLDELLAKIVALIFDIFKGAQRVFVLACQPGTTDYQPLVVRHRDVEKDIPDSDIALSRSIIQEVMEQKHALLLHDAQDDKHFGHQDSVVDLAIRSVMCAPLLYEDEVLGLVQVDTSQGPHIFSTEDLEILTGISAQMAISMRNSQLYQEIENLFEGFVKASVQVIEARDPATAGHSFRVANYTEQLAMAVDRSDRATVKKLKFDKDQIQEIRYAALLHDFGKVGVRENVLTKSKKLYPHELENLKMRFNYAQACLERQTWRELVDLLESQKLTAAEFRQHREQVEEQVRQEVHRLKEFMAMIIEVNEPGHYYDKNKGKLHLLKDLSFRDLDNKHIALLNEFEFSALSFSFGSLNQQERREIESHVSHTYEFLTLIPWTRKFAGVPDIAHAHHEKLDGTGYPQGLLSEQIPYQARIMTIADIFDALTAGDRPYREGVNTDMALDIIGNEVKAGKLDGDFYKIFVESKSYLLAE